MRLFFGLTFSKEDKIALARVSGSIDPYVTKGKAVREENYHLTLSFIGEVEQKYLDVFCSILDRIDPPVLTLNMKRLGLFPSRRHNTLILHVEPDERLTVLQQTLEQDLVSKKLIAKGGKYKPHITLFRQAVIPIVPMIEPIEISPTSVALFHSHRENNLLTYTVVCEKELGIDG